MRRPGYFKNQSPINIAKLIWHLPRFIKLYWRLFMDRRVPLYLKLIPVGALLYFISPIDIIPELISPFFGIVDDVVIVLMAFKYFIKLSPKDVVAEHVRRLEAKE